MDLPSRATEQKLDMSLDEIAEASHGAPSSSGGASDASGKSRNTRRADRIAQTGPYPSRQSRQGTGSSDAADPREESSVGRRVYVGNLSWNVRWTDLKDHMREAGPIEHAIVLESNGRSKGCGIVTYATVDAAQNAIATMNDTELLGRKIFVREDREEGSSNQARANRGCRVYVGNLSWTVKWQDLKDHMKKAGNVIHADVLEEADGRSKGCGLVEYSTAEEAQHAIATLHDSELGGRLIFVREDREPESGSISSIARRGGLGGPRGGRFGGGGRGPLMSRPPPVYQNDGYHPQADSGGVQLYVGNLPWDVNWQRLKDIFRTVAEVERTEIAEFPDGRSRGFGFVRFFNSHDAERAIDHFNGQEVNGRRIEVRLDRRDH